MEVPPRVEGRYVNYFELVHARDEFLLSFGQVLPGESGPDYKIRLVASPPYVQILWQMLAKSLDQYRQEFGDIRPPDDQP
jgi:hypothetical protein